MDSFSLKPLLATTFAAFAILAQNTLAVDPLSENDLPGTSDNPALRDHVFEISPNNDHFVDIQIGNTKYSIHNRGYLLESSLSVFPIKKYAGMELTVKRDKNKKRRTFFKVLGKGLDIKNDSLFTNKDACMEGFTVDKGIFIIPSFKIKDTHVKIKAKWPVEEIRLIKMSDTSKVYVVTMLVDKNPMKWLIFLHTTNEDCDKFEMKIDGKSKLVWSSENKYTGTIQIAEII